MIIVIGRGIAGLTAAWELARSGRGPITVLGPETDAQMATAAAVGLSAVKGARNGRLPLTPANICGHRLLPRWLEELERESGVPIARRFGGVVEPWFDTFGASDAMGFEAIYKRVFHRQPPEALGVEILKREELPEKLKNLSRILPQMRGVLHFPEDGWFDPRQALRALSVSLQQRGVTITSDRVTAIAPHIDRGLMVIGEKAVYEADDVILAAGWWSSKILENSGRYHLAQRAFAGDTLVGASGAKAVDDLDCLASFGTMNLVQVGKIRLAGSSTYEVTEEIRHGDFEVQRISSVEGLKAQFSTWAPQGAWESAEVSGGVRGRFRDRLPAFGSVFFPGESRRLILMTGYYKCGLQLAPYFAQILSRDFGRLESSEAIVPFSPGRFRL